MAERVVVSKAEQAAARYLVKSRAAKGLPVPAALVRIANAKLVRTPVNGRAATERRRAVT